MAEAEAPETDGEAPGKSNRMSLVIGFILAVVLGGAGFYATYSGMLDIGDAPKAADKTDHEAPEPSFVAVDPILISLTGSDQLRHLRFRAHLEVEPGAAESVTKLMPRILDVFNGYLRALDESELERPTALIRIRIQMLRRVQLVVGDSRVRDLLVTEFVLN